MYVLHGSIYISIYLSVYIYIYIYVGKGTHSFIFCKNLCFVRKFFSEDKSRFKP